MLLRAGCYISFGSEFNPEALRAMPLDRILAETDNDDVTIEQVINRISGTLAEEMHDRIAENTRRFLGL